MKKAISVPTPRKLPSGMYFIQMRLGGKSYSVTEKSERECIRRAQLIKSQHKAGTLAPKQEKGPTFREAMDKYIIDRENVLSPSSVITYRNVQKLRFQSIMDRPITDVIDWQAVINEESKKIAVSTLTTAWKAFSASCGIKVSVKFPQEVKEEHVFLQPEQIPVFLEAIKGSKYEIAYLFGLHSLRVSEVLGMRWENIDFEKKVFHVSGAVVRGPSGFVEKKENKNKSSNRYIPIIIPRLFELLSKSRKDSGRIVSYDRITLNRHLAIICADNNLPDIRIHGLRHSFASLCYHLGISEKVAMKIGGWSSPAIMHNIYTHIADSDMTDSVKALAEFFSTH